MILRKVTGAGFPFALKVALFLTQFLSLPEVTLNEEMYPYGGRNVIPSARKSYRPPFRPQPYNEGTVMANVIGSAGMNFLYYFHILGVACENRDRQLYKIIQNDFEFCLNKTGPLPPQVRRDPLGSIPKPCLDWAMHYRCYTNLAVDYDECLFDKSGRKKGTDALRFTHAYYKFVCGNTADTEAHLLHRYTTHDRIVDGVFQCFPRLQDRILNCVKKDKISKTLCSKFFIVHACFGKYYNDDNCRDVQPIYYMDELFRNMTKSLNCPAKDPFYYPAPTGPSYRPPDMGWSGWQSDERISHVPPTKKGWTSGREEYSRKENPLPGEQGRPWDREPFIREGQRYPGARPTYNNRDRDFESIDRGRIPSNGRADVLYVERVSNDRGRVNPNLGRDRLYADRGSGESGGRFNSKLDREKLYVDRGPVVLSAGREGLYVEGGSGERGRVNSNRGRDRVLIEDGGRGEMGRVNPSLGRDRLLIEDGGRGEMGRVNPSRGRDRLLIEGGTGQRGNPNSNRDRFANTHANRPLPDSQWSNRQTLMDVVDRGNTRGEKQSSKMRNEIDSSRGQGGGGIRPSTRDPSSYNQYESRSSNRGGGGSSTERGRNQQFFYSSSTSPRGQGQVSVSLPPPGYAVTRASQGGMEDDYDNEGSQKYYSVRQTPLASNMTSGDLGYNFSE